MTGECQRHAESGAAVCVNLAPPVAVRFARGTSTREPRRATRETADAPRDGTRELSGNAAPLLDIPSTFIIFLEAPSNLKRPRLAIHRGPFIYFFRFYVIYYKKSKSRSDHLSVSVCLASRLRAAGWGLSAELPRSRLPSSRVRQARETGPRRALRRLTGLAPFVGASTPPQHKYKYK